MKLSSILKKADSYKLRVNDTKVKTFNFKLVKDEVIARQQEARCSVEISIDHSKVEQEAKEALELKDVDKNGVLIPYETLYKRAMENAEDEMGRIKKYWDAPVGINRSTLDFRLQKYTYLKIIVLSDGKEIASVDSATYQPSNGEVHYVEEPTYSIEP